MPRRRPARLRQTPTRYAPAWYWSPRWYRTKVLPGISGVGLSVVADFEWRRFGGPGVVVEAFGRWRRFVRTPYRRLYDERYPGCGLAGCCSNPFDDRVLLEVVAHVLPRRDAKRFRRLLAQLDDEW
jgi:hypothetical protein